MARSPAPGHVLGLSPDLSPDLTAAQASTPYASVNAAWAYASDA